MQQWYFEVDHRKGALHQFPDALSRMFDESEIEAAAFEQVEDPWYTRMITDVQATPLKYKDWIVEDGKLYRYRSDPLLDPVKSGEEKLKLVVPSELREKVMYDAHCMPSSGHLGVDKAYDRVAREYYWKGMYYDVNNYVRECEQCQRYKVSQTGAQGLMGNRIVERPWVVVAANLMEFPPSKGQLKYLIVFQDLFTRWVELKPLRKADGKSVARALEELILFRWETPEFVLTDNG